MGIVPRVLPLYVTESVVDIGVGVVPGASCHDQGDRDEDAASKKGGSGE